MASFQVALKLYLYELHVCFIIVHSLSSFEVQLGLKKIPFRKGISTREKNQPRLLLFSTSLCPALELSLCPGGERGLGEGTELGAVVSLRGSEGSSLMVVRLFRHCYSISF